MRLRVNATPAMILICLLAVVVAVLSLAQAVRSTTVTYLTTDGIWWEGLSDEDRVVAVQGMLAGFNAGYNNALAQALFDVADTAAKKTGPFVYSKLSNVEIANRFNGIMKQVQRERPSFAYRAFSKTADIITSTYENHPALAKTDVSVFVACAATNGFNCDKLAKSLDRLKQ